MPDLLKATILTLSGVGSVVCAMLFIIMCCKVGFWAGFLAPASVFLALVANMAAEMMRRQ